MRVGVPRSRVPELVTAGYGLIFAIFLTLDLGTGGTTEPWGTLVFVMAFPWSMLLMFLAAWSLAHSGYPLDYYFVPCALLNMFFVFLIAKSAAKHPGAMRIDSSKDSTQKR